MKQVWIKYKTEYKRIQKEKSLKRQEIFLLVMCLGGPSGFY